ncbi:MAG: hypothetical protein AAGK04_05570 [Planctomycetota bacterium]
MIGGATNNPNILGGGSGGEGEGGEPPEIPGDPGGEPASPSGSDDGPRVAGDLEWRRRARDAEDRLTRLEEELREAKSSLEMAREELESSERRRSIDSALIEADVIDLETARLLVERAIDASSMAGGSNGEGAMADVPGTVRRVRHEKPFLFHGHVGMRGGGLAGFGGAASLEPSGDGDGLMALATQARATGDRQLLLRYLRARRSGG